MATAPHVVLTDADLLRGIFLFQSGLPRDIVEQVHTIRKRVKGVVTFSAMRRQQQDTLTRAAVQRRDFALLQRIHRYQIEQPKYARVRELLFSGTWLSAVGVGDVKIANWIETCRIDSNETAAEEIWRCAIQSRDVGMLDYVSTRKDHDIKSKLTSDHVDSVIRFNVVHVLKWLNANIDQVPYPPRPQLRAVHANAFEVVQCLHEWGYPRSWTSEIMDVAAQYGKLPIVSFLHENRSDGCTTKAMDTAAANGHIDVVRFLHENRSEGCTTKAMDAAAANGHVDVVRFLHENRSEGCTTKAMDGAAAKNRVAVVRFLIDNRHEGYTSAAIVQALAEDHKQVVALLHEYRLRSLHPASPRVEFDDQCWMRTNDLLVRYPPSRAIEHAAAGGDLAVVQILHLHCHSQCSLSPWIEAADRGHAEIVTFLLLNCDIAQGGPLMLGAVRSGDLETVMRVVRSCTREELVKAHALAVRRGFVHIVDYLVRMIGSGYVSPIAFGDA